MPNYIARKSLWWSARHPRVEQLCSKRDVSRAFKWHFLDPKDVAEFAAALPGTCIGTDKALLCIYLVMAFGWAGSPGEYTIFAWAAKRFLEHFRPQKPCWNDTVAFDSDWLMDDGVVLQPLIGDRPWRAGEVLEIAMSKVWGPGALNLKKKEEEGAWLKEQLVWGLNMSFEGSGIVSLPEQKRIKAQCLLALPELQPGFRKVPLELGREVVGSAQHWCTAQPIFLLEMGALYRVLSMREPGCPYLNPKGIEEQVRRAWDDWDEALGFMRKVFEDDSQWRATFTAAFTTFLSPNELAAIPNWGANHRFVGGDATMTRTGAVDWTDRQVLLSPTESIIQVIRDRVDPGDDENDTLIALTELVTIIQFAVAKGPDWAEAGVRLVYYVTDNMVVKIWLSKRRANHAHARVCIRILHRIEAKFGLRLCALYIRTYHNDFPDWLTRESTEIIHKDLEIQGFTLIDPPAEWMTVVDDVVQRLAVIPGESWESRRIALQIRDRNKASLVDNPPLRVKGALVELDTLWAPYAGAWVRLGGCGYRTGGRDGSQIVGIDPDVETGPTRVRWVCRSMTEDKEEREAANTWRLVKELEPEGVLLDLPWSMSETRIKGIKQQLGKLGFMVCRGKVRCTDFGDASARARHILTGFRGFDEAAVSVVGALEGQETLVRGVEHLLAQPQEVPTELWLTADAFQYVEDSRMCTSGDRMLPWPVGTVRPLDSRQRQVVHDPRGPICSARWPGTPPPWGWAERSSARWEGKPSALDPSRGKKSGGSKEAPPLSKGRDIQEKEMRAAVQALPARTAEGCLIWGESALAELESQHARCGGCKDRLEDSAWEATAKWLRAWRLQPYRPSEAPETPETDPQEAFFAELLEEQDPVGNWDARELGPTSQEEKVGGNPEAQEAARVHELPTAGHGVPPPRVSPDWEESRFGWLKDNFWALLHQEEEQDWDEPKGTSETTQAGEDGKGDIIEATGEKVGSSPKTKEGSARRKHRNELPELDDESDVEGGPIFGEASAGETESGTLKHTPTKKTKPKSLPPKMPSERAQALQDHDLVDPLAFGSSRDHLQPAQLRPMLGGPNFDREIEAYKVEMLMTKLAETTRTGYDRNWAKWVAYCTWRRESPYLPGNTVAQRKEDEERLCTFMALPAMTVGRKGGTISQILFAIRYHRLVAAWPDPLLHRQRLWGMMAGLTKVQGAPKRKYPATTRMLEWLHEYLHRDAGLDQADAAAVWAAVVIAFFFLLRLRSI